MILGNRLTTNIERLTEKERGLPAGRFFRTEAVKNRLKRDTVREDKIGGDFKQRPKHKPAVFHVVMGER